MNNGLIYNLLNTIIRKEKEGQTISPEQFTELLQLCSLEKANADYALFEKNQVITDSLRLLRGQETIAIVSGVGDLTTATEYWHATNAYHSTTEYPVIPIDIVTEVEFQERSFSDLEQPQLLWPILKIENDEILVNPDTIASIEFMYLKQPAVPYFDYYIDANDHIIYLTVGQAYTLETGEEYRDGTTTGTVNSISIELSFPEGERTNVLYAILQKLGISLNEQDAVEYGIMREQKEEAQ